jgi:hypothetical protein
MMSRKLVSDFTGIKPGANMVKCLQSQLYRMGYRRVGETGGNVDKQSYEIGTERKREG